MNNKKKISFGRMTLYEMKFSFQNCPIIISWEILASTVHGASFVVVTYITQMFFDVVTRTVTENTSLRLVILWAFLLGATFIFNQIINGVENFLIELLYEKLKGFSYLNLYKKVANIDAERFESPTFLNELNKAKEGAQYFTLPFFPIVGLATFYLAYFLGMGWYLINLEPILVMALILVFIPSVLGQSLKAVLFAKLEDESAPHRRRFQYYEACIASKEYIKETRSLSAVPFFEKLYIQSLDIFTKKAWTANKRALLIEMIIRMITLCGYLGIILLLVYTLLNNKISIGAFAALFASIQRMFAMMAEVVDTVKELTENMESMRNYIGFMEMPENEKEDITITLENQIVLKNVNYRYEGSEQENLVDINLMVKAGETVAIVGENGSGKTTLVRVMTGILSPKSGQVLYDDVDISKIRGNKVYDIISVVFQDFMKYKMTIRDNIYIGNMAKKEIQKGVKETEIKQKEEVLIDLLNKIGLSLEKFPQGLDTVLSREFGTGEMSGGEWQRVAIARGMYRSHKLIVLDEPTAAIDPLEESKLFQMFQTMTKEKTAIIVTHRLGCVKLADRIIVMNHGKICEEGTHEALLMKNGKYKELYDSQAEWYRR